MPKNMGKSCDLGEESALSTTEVDRIKELPHDIVFKILSALPTRDAVRTLLIPSFGNLWRSVYNVDFDWCPFHDCPCNTSDEGVEYEKDEKVAIDKFRRFVKSMLVNHRAQKIDKFSLNFDYRAMDSHDDLEKREVEYRKLSGDIDSWIRYAVEKDVEVLEIDLMACGPPATFKYNVPSWVLRSGSLTSLKLRGVNVVQLQIHMRALRCLFLSYVDLNEDMVRNILAGCPVLEALSVEHCMHLRELRCDSPQLKRLMVSPSLVRGPELRVICPRVTSLTLFGWIDWLNLENISSVEEIIFDFINSWHYAPSFAIEELMESIRHVRTVVIHYHPILALSGWELKNMFLSSNSWRHLVIRTMLAKENLPGIRNLLRSSTCLESLCLQIVRGKPFLTQAQSKLMHQLKLDEEKYWDPEDPCSQCAGVGQRLESIVVMGDVVNSKVLRLMQLLLRNASSLQTVVVSASLDNRSDWEKEWSWSDSSEDESEETWEDFSAKLCALPRASSQALISLPMGTIGPIGETENNRF